MISRRPPLRSQAAAGKIVRGAHGGWAVRLPITALATALLVSILPAVTSAQTAFGILNVWLKARESADAPNEQQITLYQKSKALVIGMDHYSGGWPELSNGIKDAEEVAKGLAAQGFEVISKKDLKSRDLDDTLRDFFIVDGDDPNARLLLWFAGHGDTIDGEAYLVPTDAPLPKLDAEFRSKAISLRRFGEYMREAKARHVLAIFDSCFSGGIFNVARSAPPPAITLATTQSVREFISSGEADQQVSDDGTFRKLFLDALAGKEPDADANHDGYVTGTELGLFLQQKMTNLTDNRQTPRYGKLNAYGYDRGDFVFQVGNPDVPTASKQGPSAADVAQLCQSLASNPSIAVVQSLMESYKATPIATCAQARIDELKKSQVAAVTPPVASARPLKLIAVGAPPEPPTAPTGPCGGAVTVSLSSRSSQPLSASEECALKPKDVFKECDKCPEMIVVPGGSFTMGSPNDEKERFEHEGSQHQVTILRALGVGKFTVTVDQFAEFVKETGYDAGSKCQTQEAGKWEERSSRSFRNPGFSQTGSHPAVCLSWNDAKAYAQWLSKETGKAYRLLTEAEWEYAARAGTSTRYFWGDEIGSGNANCAVCGSQWDHKQTAPVGSFKPNAFGLYDMHGNAWQWVEDCWHENYRGAPADGSAWGGGDCGRRAIRGGSWINIPTYLRAAYRGTADITVVSDVLDGFRVARSLSP
jgi:formylglycine-generating enzyme required for sulfatase activity